MNRLFESLENRGLLFWTIVGIFAVSSMGLVDYLTGYQISFSLFYLAPIVAVTWFANKRLGLMISLLSAATWLVAEIAAGQNYSYPIIHLWNTLIRFGFYFIVTYLVWELRKAHELQRALARTDHISGAINARYFSELVEMEIGRARRYQQPFTVAYIDVDNFKAVNDNLGHDTGDEVIRYIASELKILLRSTDIVARLGGDEFAILLLAAGQPEAQNVMAKLHSELTNRMRQKNWPLTLSMGAIICNIAPDSAKELLKIADQLMYTVKKRPRTTSDSPPTRVDKQGNVDKCRLRAIDHWRSLKRWITLKESICQMLYSCKVQYPLTTRMPSMIASKCCQNSKSFTWLGEILAF